MSWGRKLGPLLLAGAAFGVACAIVKGQDAGVRNALGNTSAPWVLVPFLAGARYRSVWRATLVGVATTLAALFAFYLAEAAILDLGAHPWYTDLRLTLGSGRVYERWGLVSGAIYGVLGGLWASQRLVAAPVAIGLAFIAEPLIVLFLERAGIWGGGLLLHYRWMWVSEVLIGVAGVALVLTVARRNSESATGAVRSAITSNQT